MAEERTREDYLHKIGELEDVIEAQEATIKSMQDRLDALYAKFDDKVDELVSKEEEIDSLYERIAQMRELNDKMYVLFTESQWKVRQYEESEKKKRFTPFGGEE